jgi:hypothetical protein
MCTSASASDFGNVCQPQLDQHRPPPPHVFTSAQLLPIRAMPPRISNVLVYVESWS